MSTSNIETSHVLKSAPCSAFMYQSADFWTARL